MRLDPVVEDHALSRAMWVEGDSEMSVRILEGDCLFVMPTLDENSVDAVICDPPYGLKFMGKEWDHGIPGTPFWEAARRVSKPGAYLLAFGGTRTHHRLMVAIEDAGWEIRDVLMWLYGSGFPKSMDVSKAIDKEAGHWRVRANAVESGNGAMSGPNYERTNKGEPITEPAAAWKGYGTALKPAWEPIILARKAISGTVASNVQEHGTGALNIDGCRIGNRASDPQHRPASASGVGHGKTCYGTRDGQAGVYAEGRWPANLILDEESAARLDEQSGPSTSSSKPITGVQKRRQDTGAPGKGELREQISVGYGDSGGASRFFYTAKASRSERESGLEHLPRQVTNDSTPPGTLGANSPRAGAIRSGTRHNHHPTVKPLDLMQWLCRLVTPKGGLILDPFCGSGSTGRAAVAEGFSFTGIEKTPAYAALARARITEYAPLFGDVA